jgi:hypothetical protein
MPNDWRTLHPERRAVGLLYRRAYERACELYEADPGNILLKFWAGNCSFARQDLERVSFENPGGRHEDRELGLRCARAGLTGVFDRSLAADHRYDRDLAAFRRDSYRSGVYRGVIEDLHTSAQSAVDPAEVGSGLPFPAPGENLPRWLRAVWPILAAGGVSRIVATVLVALFDAAVRLGDIRVQTVIARALGSVEIHRGMRDHAAHAARTGSPRSVLPSL